MRKIFLFTLLICLSLNVEAQTQTEFEKFINSFTLCPYPFVDSYDKTRTKINAIAETIDESLLKTFVYGQGIKPVQMYCKLKDFVAYIQFPPTDSVVVVVLSPYMRDPACGEGSLWATYSKHNYQLQDTLWTSMRGGLTPQYIDDQKFVCDLIIESTATADSIYIERKESYYLQLSVKEYQKLKTTTYKMTVGGKLKNI
jgi:hypothetical protein